MLSIKKVTCNHRPSPLMGLDPRDPVSFGWQLAGDGRNIRQTSYRAVVSRDPGFTDVEFDTGAVAGDASAAVELSGFTPRDSAVHYIRVKVTGSTGEETPWSEPYVLVTAYPVSHVWDARFISGDVRDEDADVSDAKLLRREFDVDGPIVSARAYVTAMGVYELHVNGCRVGDSHMAPGWTAYQSRILYQTYDILPLLAGGRNVLGASVGAGWYKGTMGFATVRNNYGRKAAFFCQVELTLASGKKKTVCTDASWKWSDGPVLFSEIYDGETYDARREIPGWMEKGYDDSSWHEPLVLDSPKAVLKAQDGLDVIEIQTLPVRQVITTPKGETVLDFGQNLAGYARFTVKGKAGDTVDLRHFEILDHEGNVYTENLRTAKQTVRYILRGGAAETYSPHFTFQGFRYVHVVSWPGAVHVKDFTAVAVHSDLEGTGTFSCSEPLLDQLQHNILWGLKGNFLDIPTDCPQRDERLGWTGDAQIFCATASYLKNVYPFFRKWLRDLALDQAPNGSVAHVVPNVLTTQGGGEVENVKPDIYGSAAWGDAATIVPWTLYIWYGDASILREQYPSMKRWVEYVHGQAENGTFMNSGFHYGDWVALDAREGSYFGATPNALIATAYFAHSTGILAKTARVLGLDEDARHYGDLHGKILEAYRTHFLDADGKIVPRTQTSCILSLVFGLVPEASRTHAVSLLRTIIKENGGHLTTGFVGTPYICLALSQNGYLEEAYKLLLKEDFPSWLYQVRQGATTVWEHWDGMTPDGRMWSPDMNSFNHYAYGAIGEWMYGTMAGLVPNEESPGFKHSIIRPRIGGGITSVSASHESPYGVTSVAWERKGDEVRLTVEIPVNTGATVVLEHAGAVTASGGLSAKRLPDGADAYEVGSGSWEFSFTCVK